MAGETHRIDRRGGDDHLEIRPAWKQLLEVAENEIDVQASLVGLVDDERVVCVQQPVALRLGEQDPVRHHLHQGDLADPACKAHLIADGVTQRCGQLLRDAFGHRACGDPPRLSVADHATNAATELQADLRELRGLPGARLPSDYHDLVVADRGQDVVLALADRKRRGVHHGGRRRPASGEELLGPLDLGRELVGKRP